MFLRLCLAALVLFPLAACDPAPSGSTGTSAAQNQQDAQMRARQQARRDFYRGPRGGATGR